MRRGAEGRRILEREASGPTRAEVSALEAAVAKAAAVADEARIYEALMEATRVREALVAERDIAAKQAESLRANADEVPGRLSVLLGEASKVGVVVQGGRIYLRDGADLLDWETRLSEGQRVYAALEIAARTPAANGVLALDGKYWGALDPEHRSSFADTAHKLGLYVLTEAPSLGELGVDHWPSDEEGVME